MPTRLYSSSKALEIEAEITQAFGNKLISKRGASSQEDSLPKIQELIRQLENTNAKTQTKPVASPLIDGCWKLIYTSSPGTNSPIQRTFTAIDAVSIYQVVNLLNTENSFLRQPATADGNERPLPDVSNIVCFGTKARLRVTALASTFDRPFVVPRTGMYDELLT